MIKIKDKINMKHIRTTITLLIITTLLYATQASGAFWVSMGGGEVGGGDVLIAHASGAEATGDPLTYGTGDVTHDTTNEVFTEADSGYGFDCALNRYVSIPISNINADKYKITFAYKYSSGTASYNRFYTVDDGNDYGSFTNVAATTTSYRVVYNSVTVWSNAATDDIMDGDAHTVLVSVDNNTDTVIVEFDGVAVSNDLSGVSWPATPTLSGAFYIGNRNDEARPAMGLIGDFKIYE